LLFATNIHPQWLAALESSAAGDFALERVGGIVDVQTCEFNGILHLFADLPLDLYLCWGRFKYLDRSRLHPFVAPLFPGPDEVEALSTVSVSGWPVQQKHNYQDTTLLPRQNTTSLPCQDTTSLPPNDPMLPSKLYPPVEKHSGQKVGEDWHTFFARRSDADLLKASRETLDQLQSRMQQLENAKKNNMPGRKGARVYRWEDVDGFRV
jgi:hypothetical protein